MLILMVEFGGNDKNDKLAKVGHCETLLPELVAATLGQFAIICHTKIEQF